MKYLISILLLSIAFIPFLLWFSLVYLWTFDPTPVRQLCHDFSETIESNYRKAFRRKPKRRTF